MERRLSRDDSDCEDRHRYNTNKETVSNEIKEDSAHKLHVAINFSRIDEVQQK